jgi:hypothetical protein
LQILVLSLSLWNTIESRHLFCAKPRTCPFIRKRINY